MRSGFGRPRAAVLASAALSSFVAHGAGAQAEVGDELAEVIVTAARRPENIQEVPSSVSAVGKATLDQYHVTALADLEGYVSGLQIDSEGSPGQTQISIRGIAPLGGAATVATYLGDTPVGSTSISQRGSTYAVDLLPYDLERIEVLKGPQGTLYGASSLGGVINYVLTTPSLTTTKLRAGADVLGVSGAVDPGGGARATINTPLVPGQLGLIASYGIEHTPGYIKDALTGQPAENTVQQQAGRIALLWQPTTGVEVHLGALVQRIAAAGDTEEALNAATLQPLYGRQQDDNFIDQPFANNFQLYELSVNGDLGWARVLSASGYSISTLKSVEDVTRFYGTLFPLFGSPAGISAFDLHLDTRKITQEFRLSSPAQNRLEWLGGVFYTREQNLNAQQLTAQGFTGAPVAGLNPFADLFVPFYYVEYALYGESTYHLTERFDLSVGARWAENKQHGDSVSSGPLQGDSATSASGTGSVWTYSVSPRVRVTPDLMAYLRVASGYQAGQPNLPAPGVPPNVHSDTVTNYEAGVKADLWRHSGAISLAVFDVQWQDIQVSGETSDGIGYLTNGGTARSRGFDADATLRPTEGLTLSTNVTYTNAIITEDIPSLGGVSGNRIPYIPAWSGSLRADYSRRLSADWTAELGGGVRLIGDRYATSPYALDGLKMNAYDAVDLHADVAARQWKLAVFVKNAGNSEGFLTHSPTVDAATGNITQVEGVIIQPRTIGLSVDYRY